LGERIHEKLINAMPMKKFFSYVLDQDVLNQLPKALNALTALASIGVIVGGTLTIRYCARINFFPSGISIGDGFFLMWVSVAFALIYGIFFFLMLNVALSLLWIFRPIANWWLSLLARYNRVTLPYISKIEQTSLLVFGLIFGILALARLYFTIPELFRTLLVFVPSFAIILGFINLRHPSDSPQRKAHSEPINEQNARSGNISYVLYSVMFILPFIFPGGLSGHLSEVTMRGIGIRINRADIAADKELAEYMRNILSSQSISTKTDKSCNKLCIFHDVTILMDRGWLKPIREPWSR
jgi:hypothetical protein